MKKPLTYSTFGVLLFALMVTLAPEAEARATCFCKISCGSLTGQTSATNVVLDLTGTADMTFTGLFQQNENKQQQCEARCEEVAGPYTNNPSLLPALCAQCPSGTTTINAYSAVGTKKYRHAHLIGTLINTPPTTTCTCPPGWLSNTTNVSGGVVASDGRCKQSVGQISITPLPENGTPVGSWGFTWGNALYAWGTNANGGEAQCVSSGAACAWASGPGKHDLKRKKR